MPFGRETRLQVSGSCRWLLQDGVVCSLCFIVSLCLSRSFLVECVMLALRNPLFLRDVKEEPVGCGGGCGWVIGGGGVVRCAGNENRRQWG